MARKTVEIRFKLPVGDVPVSHQEGAKEKAKEASVMELLRQGNISAGRAAELLGVTRWELSALMTRFGVSAFDETMTEESLQAEVEGALNDFSKTPSRSSRPTARP